MEKKWVDQHGGYLLKLTMEAKESGYFSLSSPDLFYTEINDLEWAIVPGHFQGRKIR